MRILAPILFALCLSAPLVAQTVNARHVDVALVSDMTAVTPGQTFRVALRFDLEKEWHTYWRNPGDAGLAPTFELSVPKGFTVGEIEWPFPHIFGEAPDVSYGYTGTVLLPVSVTVPADARGESITITAKASWLVCNEQCIPGKADLSLTLALRDELAESEQLVWFDEGERRYAIVFDEVNVSARRAADRYEIGIRYASELPGTLPQEVHFFPYEDGVVNHSAAQDYKYDARNATLTVPVSAYESEMPTHLRGVLVASTAWNGDDLRAIVVDVPID